MRVYRTVLGAAAAATATLSMSAPAWGQAPGGARAAAVDEAGVSLQEQELEARIASLWEESPPVQLGRAWERVVDAAMRQMEALPQASAPAVAIDDARSDVLSLPDPVDPVGPAEEAPSLRWRGFVITPTPVAMEPTPVVAEPRPLHAVLLGVRVRMPWLIP